jgi:flagellar protein FliO/FliZ
LDSVSFIWSFFKMLIALAVVIAMMIGAAFVLKKYFYRSPETMNGNQTIQVISTRYLDPKNSILLVDVLGQVMLLGVSTNQITLLGTVSDPNALESLKMNRLQSKTPPFSESIQSFKSLLTNMGQTKKGK